MLSPGPAAGALPFPSPPLVKRKFNSNRRHSGRAAGAAACGRPPLEIGCENNTIKDRVCRCRGVLESHVLSVRRGLPAKPTHRAGQMFNDNNAGTPVTGAGACHAATLPHSLPAQLPISPGPGTDLLLTCTLPKFRVLLFLQHHRGEPAWLTSFLVMPTKRAVKEDA